VETEVKWRCLHKNPLPEVESSMSNFDHEVEEGTAEAIADGEHMANYSGWDFHAYVYLGAEGVYVADVHRYHSHRAFIEAPTLEELMADTSAKFGWD
jgi:hypothetical protein